MPRAATTKLASGISNPITVELVGRDSPSVIKSHVVIFVTSTNTSCEVVFARMNNELPTTWAAIG